MQRAGELEIRNLKNFPCTNTCLRTNCERSLMLKACFLSSLFVQWIFVPHPPRKPNYPSHIFTHENCTKILCSEIYILPGLYHILGFKHILELVRLYNESKVFGFPIHLILWLKTQRMSNQVPGGGGELHLCFHFVVIMSQAAAGLGQEGEIAWESP